MRTVSISEAKNRLSAYLDRVRAGETILILDRGIPVAQLTPADESDGRMARLERAGIIRPPRRHRTEALSQLEQVPPGPADGTRAQDTLLEERRQGR
jgi:prevent-host-death family protein